MIRGIRSSERPVRSPAGLSELSLRSLDTRTPYVTIYSGTDGGRTAHSMLRLCRLDRRERTVKRDRQRHDRGVGHRRQLRGDRDMNFAARNNDRSGREAHPAREASP